MWGHILPFSYDLHGNMYVLILKHSLYPFFNSFHIKYRFLRKYLFEKLYSSSMGKTLLSLLCAENTQQIYKSFIKLLLEFLLMPMLQERKLNISQRYLLIHMIMLTFIEEQGYKLKHVMSEVIFVSNVSNILSI